VPSAPAREERAAAAAATPHQRRADERDSAREDGAAVCAPQQAAGSPCGRARGRRIGGRDHALGRPRGIGGHRTRVVERDDHRARGHGALPGRGRDVDRAAGQRRLSRTACRTARGVRNGRALAGAEVVDIGSWEGQAVWDEAGR
jgi:hypothetical protein